MATKEITNLETVNTYQDSDWLHLKRGTVDVKISAGNFQSESGSHGSLKNNPHEVTKAQVGLSTVTNDQQLKLFDNLADLNDVPTARDNLDVYSRAETDALVNSHENRTDNPHFVTAQQVGLGNVNNFGISDSFLEDSSTTYASSKAVYDLGQTIEGFSTVPRGVIVFLRPNEPVPSGWARCNGEVVGGLLTPDLRNRFIRCVGSSGQGTIGGSDSSVHKHGGAVLAHKLTNSQVPVLSPKIALRMADSTKSDDHSRTNTAARGSASGSTDFFGPIATGYGGDGTHTHGLSINNNTTATDNRPAFMQLSAIIKT